MAPATVQLGQLVSLYEGMTKTGVSQAERLRQAEEICADPMTLARKFDQDVQAFMSYTNPGLSFHSGSADRDSGRFAPKSKTRVVAQSLITLGGDEIQVTGRPELNFRYVDREIVSARTPGATVRTTDGQTRSASSLPTLDLLLANSLDRVPIIAELKVGDDRDPFYALIQALAHASMLVTPNQLERLAANYPRTFAADAAVVDVYVVLAGEPSGSNWEGFHDHALQLASDLVGCEPFTRWVRRVEEVRLTIRAL